MKVALRLSLSLALLDLILLKIGHLSLRWWVVDTFIQCRNTMCFR